MSLPTKPQAREGMAPRHARVLLGASAKVGKTTLLGTWAPETTLLVDTQNGSLLLDGEHYVQHVKNWPEFVGTVDDVVKGGHPFQTIGLDLVNDLWRFCDLHYGKRDDGIEIPASATDDYGRSSAKARTAFIGQISRLLSTPLGIWFLTHLREKTDKKGELVVYVPELDKNVNAYITGAVGFVWLAETRPNGSRVVHTQATKHFEAGSRVALPSPLPMDARSIATAMDQALNPGKYAAPVEPMQPVEVTPAVRQHVEDFERTGKSDLPVEQVRLPEVDDLDSDVPWGEEPPPEVAATLPVLDDEPVGA